MKFYKKNVKLEGCDKRKKISYVLKTKKQNKKEKKKKRFSGNRVRNADARMGVQRNNHCTSELCIQN